MTDPIATFFGLAKNLKLTPKEYERAQEIILCSMQQHPVRDGHCNRHKSAMRATPETIFGQAENICLTGEEKAAGLQYLREVMQKNPMESEAPSYEGEEESLIESIIQWWQMAVRLFAQKGLPTLVAVAVFVTSNGAAVTVAEAALPGDILYPVKVNYTEPIIATFSFTHKAKAEWEAKRAERRLQEAEKLSALGRMSEEVGEELATRIARHSEQAKQHLTILAANDPVKAAGVSARIEGTLSAHETLLRTVGNGSTYAVLHAARAARRSVKRVTQHTSTVPLQGVQELKERASSTLKGAIASLPARSAERPKHMRRSERERLHAEFAALQEEASFAKASGAKEQKESVQTPETSEPPAVEVVEEVPEVSMEIPASRASEPLIIADAPESATSDEEDLGEKEEVPSETEVVEVAIEKGKPTPESPAKETSLPEEEEQAIVEEETLEPHEEPEVTLEKETAEISDEVSMEEEPAAAMAFSADEEEEPTIPEAVEELLQEAEELLQEAEEELKEGNEEAAFTSAKEAERAAQEAQVLLTGQEEFWEAAKVALIVIEKAIDTIAEATAMLASTDQTNAHLLLKLQASSKKAEEMQKKANTYFEDGAYADVLKLSKKVRSLAEELSAEVEEALEALAKTQANENPEE